MCIRDSVYHLKNLAIYQSANVDRNDSALKKFSIHVNIDDYNEAWDAMRAQYNKTVTVENIYNRFVLFSGQTFHGVETFGTKPRLTINFFGRNSTLTPPLMRYETK